MQDLADKLRAMCDSVSDDSLMTAVQLFGIKYATRLRGTTLSVLDRLSLNAGLENPCGGEIRKGVNLSPFVLIRNDPLPPPLVARTPHLNDETIKLLAPKFQMVCREAPKNHLVRTVALFAIANFEEVKDLTITDIANLCEKSAIPRNHRIEFRQGQKLASYVEFKCYPSEVCRASSAETAAVDSA